MKEDLTENPQKGGTYLWRKILTSSSVLRTIIYFALPYLYLYFLQTLYGMADLFIVGQFYGVDSITAVAMAVRFCIC